MMLAIDKKGLIGSDNHLPWRCKEDMNFFVVNTTGKTMFVGRKTFESMPSITDRKMIVLSTTLSILPAPHVCVQSCEEALQMISEEEFKEAVVIGGRRLYSEFFPLVKKIYVSIMHKEYEGNIFLDANITDFLINKCPGWVEHSRICGSECDSYIYIKPD